MPHLTLYEEQADRLIEMDGTVEIRHPDGTVLGHLHLSEEVRWIRQVKQQLAPRGPGIPSEKVQALLQALDRAAAEGVTQDELRELSRRLIEEAKRN